MTGRDVPDGDMSDIPEPQRTGLPDIPEEALDRLLAGSLPAGGEPSALQPVGELLAALTAGPDRAELRGHGWALAAFRQHGPAPAAVPAGAGAAGPAPASLRTPGRRGARRRRRTGPLLPLRARLAATGAVATLALGGLTTAAYARALPAPVQRLAHDVIGAPPPAASPPGHPATPPGLGGSGRGRGRGHSLHGSRAGGHPVTPGRDAGAGGRGKPSSLPTPAGHGKPSAHPPGKPTPPPGEPSTHPARGQAAETSLSPAGTAGAVSR